MFRGVYVAVLSILIASSQASANPLPLAYHAHPQQTPEPKAKAKPKSDGASLTGCVDEKEGRYVLVNDQTLTTIARLEADGFPTEGFAKHLGHKVTVKGTSVPNGTSPVFKVRNIETVSDTCGPK